MSEQAPSPANTRPVDGVSGERGISPIGGAQSLTGKAIAVTALTVGGLLFLAATWGHGAHKKTPVTTVEPAHQTVGFEAAKPAPGSAQPPVGVDGQPIDPSAQTVPAIAPDGAAAQPAGGQMTPAQKAAALMASAQRAPLTAYAGEQSGPAGPPQAESASMAAAAGQPASATAGEPTELDRLRHGSSIGMASATNLGDRNFLILAGTSIPCILQTAMDTGTPGYVTCLIPKDIYSDNGNVVLMEKGTKVLGEYSSGMKQGQSRLFVLWNRAVTPRGIAISLASPATDAIGRAGFDGAIDTQFWKRFGGALLFSIVDDASNIASQQATNGEFNNTTNLPSQAAAIALQNSINIPPVLRKNQGSEVSIMVAQDFSFARVYGLQPR